MNYKEFEPSFVLYIGNMFGGKTASAISDCQRAEIAGKKVGAFKVSFDDRYSKKFIVTNNGQLKYSACYVRDVETLEKLAKDKDVVFIDELQFWDESIIEYIKENKNKKKIIATSLQYDFRGEPFHLRRKRFEDSQLTIGAALEIADVIKQFWPVCTFEHSKNICGDVAFYPQRWRKNKELSRYIDQTIVIGGKNFYAPRCKKHFVKPNKNGSFTLFNGNILLSRGLMSLNGKEFQEVFEDNCGNKGYLEEFLEKIED
ncbi:MAG: hypothetical protein QW273_02395 [Candidatus Pacearchaeota archaeon]